MKKRNLFLSYIVVILFFTGCVSLKDVSVYKNEEISEYKYALINSTESLTSNVGTTITAWILSLTGLSGESFIVKLFKPSSFTPLLAGIGVLMIMTAKKDKKKNIGEILVGFAILMFGMDFMSDSVSGLKDSE